MESQYIPLSHNMSNLVYHIVIPAGYRRFSITETVEQSLRQICEGIEIRWDWIRFLEVGCDGDHVHYLVQSTPDHSPDEIVKVIKSVTARRIFAEHPEVKKMLCGGKFWSDDYSVESVGLFSCHNVIAVYLKEHGLENEYRQLVLNLPCS